MVDRLRVLRAWRLRRALIAGAPLALSAGMAAWIAVSDAYPGWLKVILFPVLLIPAVALALDLGDLTARPRRRGRRTAEYVQPAAALLLVLLAAGAPHLLVPPREPAPSLADLPLRRPLPPPAPAEPAAAPLPPPQIHDETMALLGPLEDAPVAASEPAPALPPPPEPVAAAPVPPPAIPSDDEAEALRFRPDLEEFLASAHRGRGRSTPALPPSLRVEMILYLDGSQNPEGSGFLAEVDLPLGLDEGFRVFFQTTAESVDEGLFDDGPTWSWQRARIDYVRRVPFLEAVDVRVSAGLAFDRFRVTEELGISEARGGAPVFGLELTVVDEGPVRLVLHAAYTPATELSEHRAVVTELGATAFIRIVDAVHLTIGWNFVDLRLREEVDGLTHRWDDQVQGPTFGLEIRL